jgi:hypothetical protein
VRSRFTDAALIVIVLIGGAWLGNLVYHNHFGGHVERPDASWRGSISTAGTVTTVVNEAGSVWGGTASLVEEASIGVDVGDAAYMLGSVDSVAATSDRIYLLEGNPPVVRVYDMNGLHLFDIGSEGQGPGELAHPMSMVIGADDRVLVRDAGNNRMTVFSLDGELLETWPLPGGFSTS